MVSTEVGWDLGQWTPFIGAFMSNLEEELNGFGTNDETSGFNAGFWVDFDAFKLRGAMTDIENSDNRKLSGGLLFQMDNKFTVGAELGVLLDVQEDRFRFWLQFGRSF